MLLVGSQIPSSIILNMSIKGITGSALAVQGRRSLPKLDKGSTGVIFVPDQYEMRTVKKVVKSTVYTRQGPFSHLIVFKIYGKFSVRKK